MPVTDSDWTEADLARALGDGAETDLTRALAPLCVVALSSDAEARGTEWNASWDDTLTLGRTLRATIRKLLSAPSVDELTAHARTIVRSPEYADALAQVIDESGYARSIDDAKLLVVVVHEAISGMQRHTLLS